MLITLVIERKLDLINDDFYLSNFGFMFDGKNDLGRDELEFSIQSRFQGLHPAGVDYLIQARADGWQVNGSSPIGARACASVCRGHNLKPNRIDVTMDLIGASAIRFLDYELATCIITDWFSKHKRDTAISETTKLTDLKRTIYGTRTSRYSLWVEEIDNAGLPGLRITWNMRQDRVMQVYDWLNYFHTGIEYKEACRNAFAACTNTLLGPDFFGLNHPKENLLIAEKRADTSEDWWGYLSSVAHKISAKATKEKSEHLVVESVQFLEAETYKAIERKAKKMSETANRDLQAGLTVVE